jgi:hypothetical protein
MKGNEMIGLQKTFTAGAAALAIVLSTAGPAAAAGDPVHFIVHDDSSSPQNAVLAANQSLESKPNVILGPSLAAMCLAVAPLVANGPVQYCFSPAISASPRKWSA